MTSSTTQTKFWEQLESRLPYGVEMVVDHSYANSGYVRLQPKKAFEDFVKIYFSFQDAYANFTVQEPSQGFGGDGRVKYFCSDGKHFEELLHHIIRYLGKFDPIDKLV